MKKHSRKDRPTSFEVALEKGDYKLPDEIAPSRPFEDFLEGFTIGYLALGCPDVRTISRLIVWLTADRNRKETALRLGMTEDGVEKWLERLKKDYESHRQRMGYQGG